MMVDIIDWLQYLLCLLCVHRQMKQVRFQDVEAAQERARCQKEGDDTISCLVVILVKHCLLGHLLEGAQLHCLKQQLKLYLVLLKSLEADLIDLI